MAKKRGPKDKAKPSAASSPKIAKVTHIRAGHLSFVDNAVKEIQNKRPKSDKIVKQVSAMVEAFMELSGMPSLEEAEWNSMETVVDYLKEHHECEDLQNRFRAAKESKPDPLDTSQIPLSDAKLIYEGLPRDDAEESQEAMKSSPMPSSTNIDDATRKDLVAAQTYYDGQQLPRYRELYDVKKMSDTTPEAIHPLDSNNKENDSNKSLDISQVWTYMENKDFHTCYYYDEIHDAIFEQTDNRAEKRRPVNFRASLAWTQQARKNSKPGDGGIKQILPLKDHGTHPWCHYDELRLAKLLLSSLSEVSDLQQAITARNFLLRLGLRDWSTYDINKAQVQLADALVKFNGTKLIHFAIYEAIRRLENREGLEDAVRLTEASDTVAGQTPRAFKRLHPLPNLTVPATPDDLKRLWMVTDAARSWDVDDDKTCKYGPRLLRDLIELYFVDFTEFYQVEVSDETTQKIKNGMPHGGQWRFNRKACFARWSCLLLDIYSVDCQVKGNPPFDVTKVWNSEQKTRILADINGQEMASDTDYDAYCGRKYNLDLDKASTPTKNDDD